MKISLRPVFLLVIAVLFFCSYSFAQTNNQRINRSLSSTRIVLPTAKEAIRILLANGDIPMNSKTCRSMKTAEDDRTIFDYLSGILAFQAEPNSKTSIEYAVKLIKGKNGVHFWEVNLNFKGLDEGSGDPWNNGFRFLIRTRDKRMVRSSLQCIG